MAADTELLIVDEPLQSGMDPNGIGFFKREARVAAERGHTVVYSTQILDIARGSPIESASSIKAKFGIMRHSPNCRRGPRREAQGPCWKACFSSFWETAQ